MKKLMATKANDMTVGQTLQFVGLMMVVIYAPVMAVLWILDKLSSWTVKEEPDRKPVEVEDNDDEDAMVDDIWEYLDKKQ